MLNYPFEPGSFWMMRPESLSALAEERRPDGLPRCEQRWSAEQSRDVLAAVGFQSDDPRVAERNRRAGVAVVPVCGLLMQRDNWFGTSYEFIAKAIDVALQNREVGSIVLDIDSPGGSAFGLEELTDRIYAARQLKPVIAVANPVAFSAAFWIGATANEFLVTKSGDAGSVGVITIHQDWSAANEKMGIKPTYITTSKYKAEGNPDHPLDPEAEAHIRSRLGEYHKTFVAGLARGRGVSPATVEAKFGQGRTFGAAEAVSRGMADGVGGFDAGFDRAVALAKTKNREISARHQQMKTEVARNKILETRLQLTDRETGIKYGKIGR